MFRNRGLALYEGISFLEAAVADWRSVRGGKKVNSIRGFLPGKKSFRE